MLIIESFRHTQYTRTQNIQQWIPKMTSPVTDKPETDQKKKLFPELTRTQHEFVRLLILRKFHVETEDTEDFYFFALGEKDGFSFGAFTIKRMSELQCVVTSHFKEFSDVLYRDKNPGLEIRELFHIFNLPDE